MVVIDGKHVDAITMRENVDFLFGKRLYTCTFNFCNKNNWFEFYLSMSKKITDYQLKAAIILLNAGSKQVRDNS